MSNPSVMRRSCGTVITAEGGRPRDLAKRRHRLRAAVGVVHGGRLVGEDERRPAGKRAQEARAGSESGEARGPRARASARARTGSASRASS
jgi:hypothetical protein